jgi:hypothetical protein
LGRGRRKGNERWRERYNNNNDYEEESKQGESEIFVLQVALVTNK